MAATVVIVERNGPDATATETVDPSNVNLGSVDAANLVPANAPLLSQADGHSFEKWLRIRLTALGDSSIVDNLKVWISNLGGGYLTGEGMSTNLRTSDYIQATYPTGGPVETNSSVATQVMPTSEPTGPNLGIGGLLTGSFTSAPSDSDYLVLQLDISELTPRGDLNQKTITFQYDEQ